ncbi:hypothetical protein [Bifidobacterium porcinum]|uniref:hypothetical protein n=1 Tax=Bifidobacterium porcinum TaxID=212365 RepID=UPI0039924B1C
MLKCPESFVDVLASRGVLPWPVDVHALSHARLRHRWLNVLGEPVGERDLMRIDPSLHLPESGTTVLGGRRYAPLWHVLSEAWKPDEPSALSEPDGGRASALSEPVRGRASGSSALSEPVAPVRDA